MRRIATAVITGSLLLATSAAAMAEDHWSVAGSAGTTGLGANVSWRFHDHFALTAGYSGYNYDDLDRTIDDIKYEGDVDMDIYSLKLDVYPWVNSGFFLSAGVVKPDVQLNATGRPSNLNQFPDTVVIGGQAYNTNDVAGLDGRAKLSDSVEPYLGIGWRNSSKQGLGFYAEAGAFWIDPSVSLSPKTNTQDPTINALLRQYADEEENNVKDELNKYNVYPVAVIGIEYTF